MKGKLAIIIHYILLFGGMIIWKSFYPSLVLTMSPSPIQNILIRMTATLTYYGIKNPFIKTIILQVGLIILFTLFFYWRAYSKKEIRSYTSGVLLFNMFSIYFFYILTQNPGSNYEGIYFSLPAKFWLYNGLYTLGYFIVVLMISSFYTHFITKRNEYVQTVNYYTIYECPDCDQKFFSNVHYCHSCDHAIIPLKKYHQYHESK